MTPPEIVGARIRAIRRASGMTINDVARRTGMARKNLMRVEHGVSGQRLATLVALASALNTTVADLVRDLGGEHASS